MIFGCANCHRRRTAKQFNWERSNALEKLQELEKINFKDKKEIVHLEEKDKQEIIRIYIETDKTQRQIASQFGIDQPRVSIILSEYMQKPIYTEFN